MKEAFKKAGYDMSKVEDIVSFFNRPVKYNSKQQHRIAVAKEYYDLIK